MLFSRLWNIIHTLFLGSVGLASTGEMGLSVISNYTVDEVIILLLGVTWLVLSTIILLNMLIALISNAFQNVEVKLAVRIVISKQFILARIMPG